MKNFYLVILLACLPLFFGAKQSAVDRTGYFRGNTTAIRNVSNCSVDIYTTRKPDGSTLVDTLIFERLINDTWYRVPVAWDTVAVIGSNSQFYFDGNALGQIIVTSVPKTYYPQIGNGATKLRIRRISSTSLSAAANLATDTATTHVIFNYE